MNDDLPWGAIAAVLALAACAAPPVPSPPPAAGAADAPAAPGSALPLHTAVRAFTIELPAAVAVAAPLFGPVREREWSPHWAPTFVQPDPPAQEEGAVFTTDDAHGRCVWVLTDYDPDAGRVGYVALLPGVAVTRLRIDLRAVGAGACSATVTSRRTALSPAGNDDVDRFALHFEQQGPHWQQAVAGALQRAAPR